MLCTCLKVDSVKAFHCKCEQKEIAMKQLGRQFMSERRGKEMGANNRKWWGMSIPLGPIHPPLSPSCGYVVFSVEMAHLSAPKTSYILICQIILITKMCPSF